MSSRKDYSELVTALQNHKNGDASRLLKELVPRLHYYLKVRLDAAPSDAEDAVQQALLNTYEKIMQDEIKNKKYIYKYILTACRHAYVRLVRNEDRFRGEPSDYTGLLVSKEQQVLNLLDKDRQQILEECLQKLRDKSREFITYIMRHPEATTKGLSERFLLSESNVRVKKSRIINDLSHCVQKKWDT
ncbi:MAG: sigma-70 family RNA polymerase sigma factor [Balneolaceae bacterium]|nr:sigma-70 family RNA polymerase sigma factor [Balneolaceae bacterium]